MKGYWSMRVNVEDEAAYKKYAERAKLAIEKFGGKLFDEICSIQLII